MTALLRSWWFISQEPLSLFTMTVTSEPQADQFSVADPLSGRKSNSKCHIMLPFSTVWVSVSQHLKETHSESSLLLLTVLFLWAPLLFVAGQEEHLVSHPAQRTPPKTLSISTSSLKSSSITVSVSRRPKSRWSDSAFSVGTESEWSLPWEVEYRTRGVGRDNENEELEDTNGPVENGLVVGPEAHETGFA